ncbi:MAG TPA: DUF6519 domain-containing protein [Pyrinomonadaceae bacterium]|jgi:hypothetical protein
MKGDFSRDTFNLKKNFRRVLMQQGRVQLDADWNEQSAILLHYLQMLAKDLIGEHGGPGEGFALELVKEGTIPKDLIIKAGRYYVDGILCENDANVSYFEQPNFNFTDRDILQRGRFLFYLDVWERHVTCLEDESLCEVALGGIDTTTRAQVIWQVKLRELEPLSPDVRDKCANLQMPGGATSNALLIADVQSGEFDGDPCNIAPGSRYRGAENQLYRVEIHTGNVNEFGEELDIEPTFKWSRENGSVVFPIISITRSGATTEIRLAHPGRDNKFTLREGDWVEIVDDNYTLNNSAGKLLKVTVIDRDEMSVTVDGTTEILADANSKNHALLRRWDQKPGNSDDRDLVLGADNAANIIEGTGNNNWLTLEDGIRIQFVKTEEGSSVMSSYHTGDYWLIPARTATGDIIWEQEENGNPKAQPPNGIEHHYAPLGVIDNGDLTDCRRKLNPIIGKPNSRR